MIRPCRECGREVSDQAYMCPACGAPRPAEPKFDGIGWEYRSRAKLLGLPLVHVSFKYRPNRVPVVARGWLAIGQFALGAVTISQFGVGVLSLSQFTIAGWAIAQIGVAYSILAQVGAYFGSGRGQVVRSVWTLLGVEPP